MVPKHLLYQSTSKTLQFRHKFELEASKNESQVLQAINKENSIFQQKIFTFMKNANVWNGNAIIFVRQSNLLQNLKMFIGLPVVIIKPTHPKLARS